MLHAPRSSLPQVALAMTVVLAGCRGTPSPDLGLIYEHTVREVGAARVPVIVIPGILGSKLRDVEGRDVWGAFVRGAVDVDHPDGSRTFALPMASGVPLAELRDDVVATEVLDSLTYDIGFLRRLELGAYAQILTTLAVGKYRDQSLGRSGAIDYGGLHYTCFQYAYDWRRDVSEAAAGLDALIRSAQEINRSALGLADDEPVLVDVVAHSMGGLVLRYYLRYGPDPLPADGSLPDLDWEGARNVRRAILVGTPNAGSVEALDQLLEGLDLHPFFPNFRAALLGTMPAIYQLLPRTRHARVIDAVDGTPVDLFDPRVWEGYGWGLLDPMEGRTLSWLLPEALPEDRAAIAHEHLTLCLARARQLHAALDRPADRPDGLEIHLFAGDAIPTRSRLAVDAKGGVRLLDKAPGDDTVTRDSALLDERVGGAWRPGLDSPIDWSRVQFLFTDHLGLTRDLNFTDNLLYLLLEAPYP